MINRLEIRVPVEIASNKKKLISFISSKINMEIKNIFHIDIIKRSIDARSKKIKINLVIDIYINEHYQEKEIKILYNDVSSKEEVIIIGSGPAGLFAALKYLEKGNKKPIIFERGKSVKNRRRDLAKLTKEHIVNLDSNYCFGEGGAGTYSDGKLYTRVKNKKEIKNILHTLVMHGADRDILVNTHPHIGTNKLPKIIEKIRETIIRYGGEIHFNNKLTDIIINNNRIQAIEINNKDVIKTTNVILATGHSARDIFYLLNNKQIKIEAKPFAVGIRVEHSQKLIDQIQYKCKTRKKELPPSEYALSTQVNNRGVYSFCMCPGGIIAPCATDREEVVTNGWSPSKRNFPTANSGIVVQVNLEDLKKFKQYGSLAGVEFQKEIERKAWVAAGKTQKVPAQRLVDFIEKKLSKNLPKTSYIPGITSVIISEIFPDFIFNTLKEGLKIFDKKMKGFYTNDAIVHAPETRTSSPVRIPRNKGTFEHIDIKGLYPCGEGAGFAGGIVSAAIDGQKCANAIK